MDNPGERRRTTRAPIQIDATLRFEDSSIVECTTIDVSSEGAKLSIPRGTPMLGGEFMVLADHPRMRSRPARMVWRRDGEVGIRFV